jgi:hypothetical protein
VGDTVSAETKRSEPGPDVRDLVRLSDAWVGRPDLFEAFLAGYGRSLTAARCTGVAAYVDTWGNA